MEVSAKMVKDICIMCKVLIKPIEKKWGKTSSTNKPEDVKKEVEQ